MKILLAEDQIISRVVLEEWVTSWGFEAISAGNGALAWDLLQETEQPPRLAIVDWLMPELDGISLCRRIKEDRRLPFIYIIMLTSKHAKEDLITGLEAGADDFVSKPVEPEELHSRIKVGQRILGYQRRLEELDAQKSRFLGMAAHDLRNPLTSLIGFSQVLLDNPDLEAERRKEFLTIIQRTGEEMLGTLNDLLDITMIESGKLSLDRQPTDFAALVRYRVYLYAITAQKKQLEIISSLPPKLELSCDPERIGQVLDNFLSNAIKYSPPRSTITVSLSRHATGRAELAVQDQGPGIPAEKQARVFGAFERLGIKPTGGERSTGLGLAISKKIIEAHGGQIGFDSVPGVGSRFFFSLDGSNPEAG